MIKTPFQLELADNIRRTIKRLRAQGTVGMSLDNLRQVTPTPRVSAGAPVGTNRQWVYMTMFNEIAQAIAGRFLIGGAR